MAKKKTTTKKAAVKRKAAPKKTTVKKKKTTVKKVGSKRGAGLNKITYSVSAELAAVVGNKKMTRPQIVKELWAYIKAKKCQDDKNKRMINPDSKLSAVLGSRPVDMLKLAGLINKHIKA